ncbi:L-galactose dehydrogenase [Kitasatospora sp. MAP12-15]|uniref:aldo/keto reductase n=1 Tax=unclassified Kitasatospora TaxID=2633591 RepID=UPI002475A645|nr:aldo/keto reductase [Kitasatospora sp. MAP12-44]MDH6115449.1 L-galactose dehydrogenase [Kitasatospora sp. MAP12-44]
MEYRRLGNTGLEVSRLGLGTTSFMGIFGRRDPEESLRTLLHGLDSGINLIDTAPSYGGGLAEEMVGRALRGRRDEVVVGTKVGCYAPEEFDFSARRIRAEFEASLDRLGTDHVDVLLAHDIEFGEPGQVIGEVLPLLEQLRAEGRARAIGVSGLTLPVLAAALEAASLDVVLSYCRYGLHDQGLAGSAADWSGRQVATLLGSPVAMGLLTTGGAPSWHPAAPELKAAAARAAALCAGHGTDLAFLAMQFASGQDDLASVLTGTGSRSHLEENIRAFGTAPDPELLKAVTAIFAEVPQNTWKNEGENEEWQEKIA